MNDDKHLGPDGTAICHYYEALKLLAYPDPGSALFKALRKAGIDPYNLRTVPPAYQHLSGNPWTIGWGDTGGVEPGDEITEAEADARFARRMAQEFESLVRRHVHIELDQRQFDAVTCAVYNIGAGQQGVADGFLQLRTGPSTFLRKLNGGDIAGAAQEFPKWNRSGGQVMKGLQRRRHAEMLVFMGSPADAAIRAALAVYP